MAYIGSLDQGTTSTRFIVFDESLTPVVSHQVEHKQITPHPGWLEHDPSEIFQNAKTCIAEAIKLLEKKKGPHAQVRAMGITNQRETTVAWSRSSGKPLYNAVVWSDARTQETVNKISNGDTEFARGICGLPASTYFSAMKMRWMLDNVSSVADAHSSGDLMFGTIDCWLMWNLSDRKVYVSDCTNASRTMLMNLKTLQWDDGLCQRFGISQRSLPKIVSCAQRYAEYRIPGSYTIPVTGCIGDQQGALVGQLCFEPGTAKNTYGTGCFLLCNVGNKVVASKRGLLSTVGFQLGPNRECFYALEGAIAGAGATVQWLRDKLEFFSDASHSERMAKTVPNSGGVVFVPAFGGLLAPYWRPDARATIVGMTQHTSKAHIVRAALDAVAQQVTQLVKAMEQDASISCSSLAVDGGMTKNALLMQIQADSLGKPLLVPAMVETTALGAAICASVCDNLWGKNLTSLSKLKTGVKKVEPTTTAEQRDQMQAQWDRAVKRSVGWAKL